MRRLILYIVLILSISCVSAAQEKTGTLVGRVVDANSGEPLSGANVFIRGTFLGTASDINGDFRIRRIPPGAHTIVVSIVGYQRQLIDRVQFQAGEERTLNVQLKPIIIQTEQVVITASRREQSMEEIPVSVSTVSAEMIADRNIVTLDDALRYVPGVNMLQDQINIRGSTGYSRGVGSRVLLLLDGMPFITGDTGEINWETIPTYQVERVEIVKGAGSALYGSSALGGVVNVITKDIDESPRLQFRAYSGLYDKPRYSEWDWSSKRRFNSGGIVTYSDKVGSFGYLLSASRSVDDSYRENDAYHRWSLFSKVKYDLSTFSSLSLTANYLARTHGNFFWWKNLREATRPATLQVNGKVRVKRGNLGFAYKEFLSDQFFFTIKAMYFGNFWQDDSAGQINNTSTSHLFSLETQGTYEISTSNILTLGLAGHYDQVEANLFGTHPGFGVAAYIQNELALGAGTKLTGGIRFDAQRVSALSLVAQLHPKIGMVYAPDQRTTLRASLGTGYRYPSIAELFISSPINISDIAILPNPDLQVEKSLTYEIGLSRILSDHLHLDAALFKNDFRNLIEAGVKIKNVKRAPSDLQGVDRAVIQFDNVTKARIQGGEVGLKIQWLERLLSTDLSYTYIWPWDVAESRVLNFRPRHIFYGSTLLTWERLRAAFDFRYVSRIERIDENLVRLAPIIHGDQRVEIKVVDVRASYDFAVLEAPFRFGLNVNNALNYHYVELIGNLAPVRTFFLSISGIL